MTIRMPPPEADARQEIQLDVADELRLLEQMALIRQFEQVAYLRFLKNEILARSTSRRARKPSPWASAARSSDVTGSTSTHRPHGHALAKGMDPKVAMAEIYGRDSGCLRGRGGSMHLGDTELGILPSIAIVGGGITIAPGLALALQRLDPGAVAVCFFGDGAVNEGAFHEGVNFAAIRGVPVIFVCENNLYGASTPFDEATRNTDVASRAAAYGIPGERVDGMDVLAVRAATERALGRARSSGGPTLIEALTYRYVGHSRGDARGYRSKEEEAEWKARDPIERYRGSLLKRGVASEDAIGAAMERAKTTMGDALLFAQQAPQGDPGSAIDPGAVYAAPPVEHGFAEPLPEGPEGRQLTISQALREGIHEEMAADARVVLLGEDVGVPGGFGGAFGVYLGLAEEYGRDRVIDTPISEKALVGAAIGSAIAGLRPLPDLQYADFVFEAMDELVNEAAKLRYMSGGVLSVPMVLRCPVGATQRGAQHGQCPESYFMHVPGLKVLCISDPYTAKGGIKAALRDPDPVLVFEHKLLYGAKRKEAGSIDTRAWVPEDDYSIDVGRARLRRRGTDVTVVATFMQLYAALGMAEEMAARGLSIEVIDPVWLAPFDWASIEASVRRTGRLVVAHEATITGGWGAEVAARISERCFDQLKAPVVRVASRDVPMPFAPWLEGAVLPTREDLAAAIERVMEGSARTSPEQR